ncbi:PP2C family protein-serine/threonine phosphatase [Streptomyces sp. H10-C2]|uniref:PP2C family protein-serine/threonine phosphatase n=1 Tax=unclassified Streptomyces TaxID=2593676 RepID=UPI0024B96771|nr:MULTISPECIES: PP2C family protein-serine/threonine phosphatase [unclassified Streptomyces]MDJ0342083.1 PP2C family protein-serine/threonine phosphatase [Streptomyces sp. PH10-H1]MDJ0368425.1 PP2C family protein-serine/threonine phosphatase [Streptomyces sp. H10-C2]
MSTARLPKVAGTKPPIPAAPHTAAPAAECRPVDQLAAVQDRLACWISDLTTLHELTERLARTTGLDESLREVLRAGAALVGARRGLLVLEPADRLGPDTTVGLGLGHADLGTIETVPRGAASYGILIDDGDNGDDDSSGAGTGRSTDAAPDRTAQESTAAGTAADTDGHHPAGRNEVIHPDLPQEPGLDPRHREVAAHLGFGASYALRLTTESTGHLGAAVWLYDEPAEPVERQRHLVGLYGRYAAEHLARQLELSRARATVATLGEELLPARLPRVAGVRMAVRHHSGPRGGGDWYDALPLPEGALGLAVGGVTGSGPSAVAAMGRLRASLRAYAVMEGEDPVAVLSDLELLLRLTEPARSATALFAYAEPERHRLVLAGAGQCPPLIVGEHRIEYVETSLSAPLGMLSCWEAPSVEVRPEPGETLLLFTDGLLHRTGEPMDRALVRLYAAAQSAPRATREDPDLLADHVLRTVLPDGLATIDSPEDVVLLAVRFD